ncbi:MAG: hypothetical protein OET44_10200 [Gammaproteobacteria bacterium]|nr:hypothetical protein [Gammaproteobacteria bacterium]
MSQNRISPAAQAILVTVALVITVAGKPATEAILVAFLLSAFIAIVGATSLL